MKIVLHKIPPTINKYIGRSNIWQYQKDKKEYTVFVLEAIDKEHNIEKCEITIKYYFKDKRRRDLENYLKILMDALVEAKVIIDDNYEVITKMTLIGNVDSKNPRIEIEVLEC